MEAEESMISNMNKSNFSNDKIKSSGGVRHSSGKRKKSNAERIGLHKEKR